MMKRNVRPTRVRFCVAAFVALATLATSRGAAAEGDEPVAANPFVLHIPHCTATDVVIGDLDQIDAEKGLGRGGAAVDAIERVMRTSSVAPRGVADLELVVRTNGSQSLRVLWASRQRRDWDGLVSGIEHIVSSDQVRMPQKSLGMKIVVRVEAGMVYADGCPVRDGGSQSTFTGAYPMGCGTRPIPPPSERVSCGRRGRSTEQPSRVVHARILSEARIPDPAQPTQRTKT